MGPKVLGVVLEEETVADVELRGQDVAWTDKHKAFRQQAGERNRETGGSRGFNRGGGWLLRERGC